MLIGFGGLCTAFGNGIPPLLGNGCGCGIGLVEAADDDMPNLAAIIWARSW